MSEKHDYRDTDALSEWFCMSYNVKMSLFCFASLVCILVDSLSIFLTVTICVHNEISVNVIFCAIYVTFRDASVLHRIHEFATCVYT